METRVSGRSMYEPSFGVSVRDRLFLLHPRSLGESYWEHQRHALEFGTLMIAAGIACVIHALVPALFVRTASQTISHLHDRLVRTRRISARRPLGS
jgi:hypothetical protein